GTDIPVAHRSVSRRPHARVRFDPEVGELYVQDLGRMPGTFLDGHRIGTEMVTASAGSVLRVGSALFVFNAWTEHPLLPSGPPPDVSYARALAEATVTQAARIDVHVLLLGPTGAGKERLAELYHASTGATGRLVAVNCAGIPSDLFAAEVFGHERGAFSGADRSRPGLWRSADNGTLFLDEVAELPGDQQSAVLRALDQGSVRPIGSDTDVRVKARVIAATSRDVDQLEEEGRIRPDLLGRLAGLRVPVPSLKDRKEEILPLLQRALGPRAAPLSPEVAERLLLYTWPKNVRELLNVAEVLKLYVETVDEITVDMLPETIRRELQLPAGSTVRRSLEPRTDSSSTLGAPPPKPRPGAPPPKPRPSAPMSREEIEALLLEYRGNIERIAKHLSVGRATIHRWLAKHGLDPQPYRDNPSE
ncbi:MAG: sigma 54-interacting transcriptional regulator, partial [Myxococcota bacterium]